VNQNDRNQLEIAHLKLDDMRQDIVDLKKDMEKAHTKTEESLKFIKENLFDPHQGLWAETKQNTQYRTDAKKWRYGVGILVIGAWLKNFWEMF
jgi:t-SNARE complex subunit (syntaxin)|tara:strand:+ start:1085 stop:1363 length:279 start_codon:yes stop_codon:yes gene_type:complete